MEKQTRPFEKQTKYLKKACKNFLISVILVGLFSATILNFDSINPPIADIIVWLTILVFPFFTLAFIYYLLKFMTTDKDGNSLVGYLANDRAL